MSLDAPLLMRKRHVGVALETTTGTAASLTGADCGLLLYDPVFAADATDVERENVGDFGTLQSVPGAFSGTAAFWSFLTGIGTGSGQHSRLLQGCGFTVDDGVYTANIDAAQTLTMGLYTAGRLEQLIGAMGSVRFTFTNGQPARADWNFRGAWANPSSVALPSPTLPVLLPPRCAAATITIGGTAYRFDTLTLDVGNQVIVREDMSTASGYRSAWITNRLPTVSVAPEALPLGTKDWFASHRISDEAALSLQIGNVAGNIITIAATMQLSRSPQTGNRNGIVTDGLNFKVNKDVLTVTCT